MRIQIVQDAALRHPTPWLWVRSRAPDWWRLMVAELGWATALAATAHCSAGLLFDAGVVPLTADEMSCLLLFPYTPKPNEQRGTRRPALAPWIRLFRHNALSCCAPFHPSLPFSPLSPLYITQSINLSCSPFNRACFLNHDDHPRNVVSPLGSWCAVTWHGLRG